MNAKELADVFNTYDEPHDWGAQAQAMLRQFDLAESIIKQQELEIKSMQERMIVAEQELNHMRSFFGCDPAYYGLTPAEPVAWMQVHYKDNRPTKFSKVQTWEDDVPLYTHPAKELNDEDVQDALYVADITLENLSDGDIPMERIKSFARAILRKAQEK